MRWLVVNVFKGRGGFVCLMREGGQGEKSDDGVCEAIVVIEGFRNGNWE